MQAKEWRDLAERVAGGGLCLYVALFPFHHLFPWNVLVSRAGLIVAASAGLAACFLDRRSPVVPSPVTAIFGLFVTVSALSALLGVDPLASSHAVGKSLLRATAVFLLAAGLSRAERWREELATALSLSGVGLAAVGFALFFLGIQNAFGGVTVPGIDYNSICMLLVPAAAFALRGASRARRHRAWVLTGAAALVVAAVALSYSRIGWAAFAILIATLWVSLPAARRHVAGTALAGVLAFALLSPGLGSVAAITDNDRFLSNRDAELDSRYFTKLTWREVLTMNNRLEYAWKPAVRLIGRRPVLGAGYGELTFDRLLHGEKVLWHEHNAVLSVAVQSGLVGVATYLALLAAVIVSTLRSLRRTGSGADRSLAAALLAAFVAEYLFQGLGEPTNNGRMGTLFALLAGMSVGLAAREEEPSADPAGPEAR